MVLSSVSGLAGPLMYLFPNWTALPRGQPVDGRLGGTIDISELRSDTRLDPPAKGVRATLEVDRKNRDNTRTAKTNSVDNQPVTIFLIVASL